MRTVENVPYHAADRTPSAPDGRLSVQVVLSDRDQRQRLVSHLDVAVEDVVVGRRLLERWQSEREVAARNPRGVDEVE